MKKGKARIEEIELELLAIAHEVNNQQLWTLNGFNFEAGRTSTVATAKYFKAKTIELNEEIERIKGELNE